MGALNPGEENGTNMVSMALKRPMKGFLPLVLISTQSHKLLLLLTYLPLVHSPPNKACYGRHSYIVINSGEKMEQIWEVWPSNSPCKVFFLWYPFQRNLTSTSHRHILQICQKTYCDSLATACFPSRKIVGIRPI